MPLRIVASHHVLISLIVLAFHGAFASECFGQIRTANFVVYAEEPALARQVAEKAEEYRKELAELWLGEELPEWPQPCPIQVEIQRHAGGETSFAFSPDRTGRSQPFDWRMKIYGSPERILDSVLPHEVTHTIFATHYGRPLPRWADEGACTTVEFEGERKKNHQMLIEFLSTGRGIPFNHMFAMKQYPRDILPLYAQGYSLARFLILQKGHRHFVNFVGEGMQHEVTGQEPRTWNRVTEKYYGYEDLSDLQLGWIAWVKKGCPTLERSAVANAKTQPRQNLGATPVSGPPATSGMVAIQRPSQPVMNHSVNPSAKADQNESWYVRQSRKGGSATMQRPESGKRGSDSARRYSPGSIGETKWR